MNPWIAFILLSILVAEAYATQYCCGDCCVPSSHRCDGTAHCPNGCDEDYGCTGPCSYSPCDPNADCYDGTADVGSYTCWCREQYQGSGLECTSKSGYASDLLPTTATTTGQDVATQYCCGDCCVPSSHRCDGTVHCPNGCDEDYGCTGPCSYSPCDPNADCYDGTAQVGSYTCWCREQYQGSGLECTSKSGYASDLLPTTATTAGQDVATQYCCGDCCVPSSHRCDGTVHCPNGCDEDYGCTGPCSYSPCDPNADCYDGTAQVGSYTCWCRDQYEGSGLECTVKSGHASDFLPTTATTVRHDDVNVVGIAVGVTIAGTILFIVLPITICLIIWFCFLRAAAQPHRGRTYVTLAAVPTTSPEVVSTTSQKSTAVPTAAYPVGEYNYPMQEAPPPYDGHYPAQPPPQPGYPGYPTQQGYPLQETASYPTKEAQQPGCPPQEGYPPQQ